MSESYKIYASKDYVDERALPGGATGYQQLVTDGESKAVWEDRLAWTEKVEITWDGNIEGLTSVATDMWVAYKVSDIVITDEQIPYITFWNNVGQSWDYSTISWDWDRSGIVFGNLLIIVREANTLYNHSVLFEEPGLYVIGAGRYWVEKIVCDLETIHTIPAKYITGSELTESDNGKILGVVDGAYGLVNININNITQTTGDELILNCN